MEDIFKAVGNICRPRQKNRDTEISVEKNGVEFFIEDYYYDRFDDWYVIKEVNWWRKDFSDEENEEINQYLTDNEQEIIEELSYILNTSF